LSKFAHIIEIRFCNKYQMTTIKHKYISKYYSKSVDFLIFVSIFISSIVFFKQPFEFYFHYIIFLMLLPFFVLKFRLPRFVLQVLLMTLSVGIINIILGNCDSFQFIKTWGGLLLSIFFYSYVIQYYEFNLKYIYDQYLKWSYWMAILAIFQLVSFYVGFKQGYTFFGLLNKWGFNEGGIVGVRLNGIFSEPSTLAVVLAPAVYVAVYNIIHKENYVLNKWQSMALIFVYLGSGSSTAFIGLLVILVLVTDSIRIRYIALGSVGVSFAFTLLYNNVAEFKSRVDTSLALWVEQDYSVENTNTSSFVLYNNFNVMTGSFAEHPIFGTGLGSYGVAYERHTLTKTVIEYDFEFNKTDANSMLLRMLVETGLLGTGFFVILLIRGFIGRSAVGEERPFRLISQGILIMILLYLLRQGNYFLNALPMFVMIYYFNWKQFKAFQHEKKVLNERDEAHGNEEVSPVISATN
jgi:hypothetical protein